MIKERRLLSADVNLFLKLGLVLILEANHSFGCKISMA
jgi:hypothetical protein